MYGMPRDLQEMVASIRTGDLESFMERMETLLAAIPYSVKYRNQPTSERSSKWLYSLYSN